MKRDYNRDIYKHLEEVLNRVDKLESTIKDDKVEIRRLNVTVQPMAELLLLILFFIREF